MTPTRNQGYLCFTPSTPEEEAAAAFRQKFRVMPEYIFEFKRLLWCGPIPQKVEEENEI